MFVINKDSLEYSCSVVSVCDALLLETSYQNSCKGDIDHIISGDNRAFVVNRLDKVLRRVIAVFGDAYIPSSFYTDKEDMCGFSVSFTDRAVGDMLHQIPFLDAMINDYIVSYIKNDWNVLMGSISESEISNEELWRSVNALFSYKYGSSYEIKEV